MEQTNNRPAQFGLLPSADTDHPDSSFSSGQEEGRAAVGGGLDGGNMGGAWCRALSGGPSTKLKPNQCESLSARSKPLSN